VTKNVANSNKERIYRTCVLAYVLIYVIRTNKMITFYIKVLI